MNKLFPSAEYTKKNEKERPLNIWEKAKIEKRKKREELEKIRRKEKDRFKKKKWKNGATKRSVPQEINYFKSNRHRCGFNIDIWEDIDNFILHWNYLRNKLVAVKKDHALFITDPQWISLAAHHNSVKRYGEQKLRNMIEEQLELKEKRGKQQDLFSMIDEVSPSLQKKWNKQLRKGA